MELDAPSNRIPEQRQVGTGGIVEGLSKDPDEGIDDGLDEKNCGWNRSWLDCQ